MPISAGNQKRYPPEWPQVRLQILERAKWKCEHPGCQAAQYAVGHWIIGEGDAAKWRPMVGNTPATTADDRAMHAAGQGLKPDGMPWTYRDARAFIDRFAWPPEEVPIIIVLTVAHLNHQPEDCRPENLAAWCQRHHLAYDLEHHQRNAYATRRKGKAIRELF